jgi:threonine dehydratase
MQENYVERILKAKVYDVAIETPLDAAPRLSRRLNNRVLFKREDLQPVFSFKIRGAYNKIAQLSQITAQRGVICASAGNHAQGVALAARTRKIPALIVMPLTTPEIKVRAVADLGAEIVLHGDDYDQAYEHALVLARERALVFVHPFDDPDVIAGQGGLGLELLAQIPDLARVIVPVGGGGLISGVAIAVKSERPDVEVIGVQAANCAPVLASMSAGEPVAVDFALTIADGIAVKRPGQLTLGLIRRWVDRMVVVGEDEVAEAMVLLLERAKLVVEGAGAVGVAALLAEEVKAGPGTTAIVLSGGNVDAGLLAQIARRHESQAGRRLVLLARLPDRPGSLALLLSLVAHQGANLLDVEHIREGFDLHVRETAVQLVLETRGPDHAARVARALREAGYAEPRTVR